MNAPELKQFAAQGFNRVALFAESLVGQETPLSLYLKLTQDLGKKIPTYLNPFMVANVLVATPSLVYPLVPSLEA